VVGIIGYLAVVGEQPSDPCKHGKVTLTDIINTLIPWSLSKAPHRVVAPFLCYRQFFNHSSKILRIYSCDCGDFSEDLFSDFTKDSFSDFSENSFSDFSKDSFSDCSEDSFSDFSEDSFSDFTDE